MVNRIKFFLAIFGLFLITLVVFAQVRHFSFTTYDDNIYVTENHYVKQGLTLDSVCWAFRATRSLHWHPVTWLSHMLDVQLFGMAPGAQHIVNLLIHILNALLLFHILHSLTRAMWPSFMVAALFAVHPLHVESVAWIADRKDLLCAMFGFLAILAYCGYVKSRKPLYYLLLMVAFILGLMSKPMLVTLPFLLLLIDFWPLQRFAIGIPAVDRNIHPSASSKTHADPTSWMVLLAEKIPLIALTIASGAATLLIMEWRPGFSIERLLPSSQQIGGVLIAWGQYLWKTLIPHHLTIHYSKLSSPPFWMVACTGAVLAGITVLAVKRRRQSPYLLFGWLWYLGTILPVLGIVTIGPPRMADRFTYLPLIGIFVMLIWGAGDLVNKWRYRKTGLVIAAVVWLLVLAGLAWVQTGHWKNSETLYRHAIAIDNDNYLAHNNLGIILAKQGKAEQALYHYRRVVEIKPRYSKIYNNIGIIYAEKGDSQQAIDHFKKALRINPLNAKAHNNLGFAVEQLGDLQQAITHYKKALEINPHYERGFENLRAAKARQAQHSQ